MDDLEYELKKMRLEPGDIVLLRTSRHLTREQSNALYEMLHQVIGHANKSLILSDGFDISVLSRAEREELLR